MKDPHDSAARNCPPPRVVSTYRIHMRTLFVATAYAAADARAKLRALVGMGHAVAAVVPEGAGAASADDGNVRLFPIPVRGAPGPRLAWDSRALERAFADAAPELVQVEEEPWTSVATRSAALAGRHGATLVQYTAETHPEGLPLLGRTRRAAIFRRASGIATASGIAADQVRALRPDVPVAVVPQLGVTPPPPAEPRAAGALSLGFVGRLVPSKGVDLLLRALLHVHGDWTLTVIGTGPEQEALEELSARLGLASQVRWLGALPAKQLGQVWPEIECLVLPARTVPGLVEATGRVVVDAMSRGIPAVVSASGALPETVAEGGLVVPEDDEAALRDTLQRLHDEPATRAALGAAARRRVLAEYAPDAVARRTAALWEAAVAARAATGGRRP
jgi:glycosyltransferase involved in cell wall biosynthesis